MNSFLMLAFASNIIWDQGLTTLGVAGKLCRRQSSQTYIRGPGLNQLDQLCVTLWTIKTSMQSWLMFNVSWFPEIGSQDLHYDVHKYLFGTIWFCWFPQGAPKWTCGKVAPLTKGEISLSFTQLPYLKGNYDLHDLEYPYEHGNFENCDLNLHDFQPEAQLEGWNSAKVQLDKAEVLANCIFIVVLCPTKTHKLHVLTVTQC
jgi:hypothetical protein